MIPEVGTKVHRRNLSGETLEIVAVAENVVLRNEIGFFHTAPFKAFYQDWYELCGF